jgi:hypothetical protein
MTDIDSLQTNILKLIKDENYDVEDLMVILKSVVNFADNKIFISNISRIAAILTADRDGSGTFTIDDITLLSKDPTALISLVTLIITTLCSIPSLKVQYTEGNAEILVFELLAYIFLVIVPKQAKIKWAYEDKVQIVTLSVLIVEQIKSSQMLQQIFADALQWFKKNVHCNCMKPNTGTNQEILTSKIAHHELVITHAIDTAREKELMKQEISDLKKLIKQ